MGFLVNPFISYPSGGGSYIVDDYSPLAAYSLRKVSSTATNAIRVRRTSDSAEQDIGFSGDDLDTASLESFCSATDGWVVKWYDQSGSNHALQSTSTNQPKIVSSGTTLVDPSNGLPAIDFDTTNRYFALTSSITITQDFAQAWVLNRTTGVNGVSLGKSGSNNPITERWATNDIIYTAPNTSLTAQDTDTSTGDILMFTLRDSASDVKYWVNNSAGTTRNLTGTGATLTYLGRTSSVNHKDEMQELIFWNSDVESSRGDIQTNINDYYSIY